MSENRKVQQLMRELEKQKEELDKAKTKLEQERASQQLVRLKVSGDLYRPQPGDERPDNIELTPGEKRRLEKVKQRVLEGIGDEQATVVTVSTEQLQALEAQTARSMAQRELDALNEE